MPLLGQRLIFRTAGLHDRGNDPLRFDYICVNLFYSNVYTG